MNIMKDHDLLKYLNSLWLQRKPPYEEIATEDTDIITGSNFIGGAAWNLLNLVFAPKEIILPAMDNFLTSFERCIKKYKNNDKEKFSRYMRFVRTLTVIYNELIKRGVELEQFPIDISTCNHRYWDKHKNEFPELNHAAAYGRKKREMIKNAPFMIVRSNGETLHYDPCSNIFVMALSDGSPKTMFRPAVGITWFQAMNRGDALTSKYCKVCGFCYGNIHFRLLEQMLFYGFLSSEQEDAKSPIIDYYPWGEDGKTPTYDICACCGGEFGFDDDIHACGKPIQVYRSKWISEGANFYNPSERPENWKLEDQLKNIPEEFV